jgi:hypothetical protein
VEVVNTDRTQYEYYQSLINGSVSPKTKDQDLKITQLLPTARQLDVDAGAKQLGAVKWPSVQGGHSKWAHRYPDSPVIDANGR